MEWFTTWHRGDQLVFDDVNDTHESVQPRLRDEPVVPESGQSAAASGDAEPLARAQALVRVVRRTGTPGERPAEGKSPARPRQVVDNPSSAARCRHVRPTASRAPALAWRTFR